MVPRYYKYCCRTWYALNFSLHGVPAISVTKLFFVVTGFSHAAFEKSTRNVFSSQHITMKQSSITKTVCSSQQSTYLYIHKLCARWYIIIFRHNVAFIKWPSNFLWTVQKLYDNKEWFKRKLHITMKNFVYYLLLRIGHLKYLFMPFIWRVNTMGSLKHFYQ